MLFLIRPSRRWPVQFTILIFVLCMIAAPLGYAAKEGRPFWTEKSAFIEGEDLYVVGVASKAKNAEEGRRQAFEQGKIELMNYAQVTSLEAQGLVIETQMTFEEANLDNSINVFRLLRVPASKLVAIQGRLQAQSKLQEHTLEQSRKELLAIQQSLVQKQQELERRSKGVQETFATVSQLQVTLGEKAMKLDQQQRQVEQLVQQLATKLGVNSKTSKGSPSSSLMLNDLSAVEAKLDAQEEEVATIAKRARARIDREVESHRTKCKYVVKGMTRDDVRSVMGEPAFINMNGRYWSYGTKQVITINFNDTGGVWQIDECGASK